MNAFLAWCDANADGLAFMLDTFLVLLAMVLLALFVEWFRSRGMRRRRRIREALTRYHQSIGAP